MYKVLIIEDDKRICEELMLVLKNSNFETCTLELLGDRARQIKEIKPHLILLDINLPECDGFSLCTEIRDFSKVPIIFVTSRNTDMDELRSMTLGGDDFITKPYNIFILIARMNALLKRAYPGEEREVLIHNGVALEIETSKVSFEGKSIELTKNEFKILYYLFKNTSKINARADLIEYLWDNRLFVDDNTLSVNITRIRNKLEQIGVYNFIITKHRQGYKI